MGMFAAAGLLIPTHSIPVNHCGTIGRNWK